MSTGTDAAIEASDVTLLHGDVSKIAEAVLLGRATLRTIRQNLAWAFGYNVLAIPIAAAGLLNPLVAGAAMALSSISVMANSLRLRATAPAIAERSGNNYAGRRFGFFAANRGPALALVAATVVLVVPLVVFTAIDRGWFDGNGGSEAVDDEHHVSVELSNWAIDLSRDTVAAGLVTFEARHEESHAHGETDAGQVHDMVILRRTPAGLEIVARTPELANGESASLTIELVPGEYEVQCNVVEEVDGEMIVHLEEGMRARLTVA
jgi:hypothetical protein